MFMINEGSRGYAALTLCPLVPGTLLPLTLFDQGAIRGFVTNSFFARFMNGPSLSRFPQGAPLRVETKSWMICNRRKRLYNDLLFSLCDVYN